MTASGSVPLARGGGEPSRLTFALKDVDVARVLDRSLRDTMGPTAFLVSMNGEVTAGAPSLSSLDARGQLTRAELTADSGTLGLAGPAVLSYLTWETAKIRSTQSATDILYVDFFTVVVGEVLAKYIVLATHVAV